MEQTTEYLYKKQRGMVKIPMTNDYQFRALMQMNEKVLRALVGALLHLENQDIVSIEIKNAIELGTYIEDKDFILDLKILLNNHTIVNLELQVVNEHNWCERSMLYLCRTFDNVNNGEDYLNVLPAVQIGLLDFDLFEDRKEFYSSYMLMNTKTHALYSDKLRLNVLELKRYNLATEEDKKWKLDKWAQFFKSKTWEAIEMLAKDLPVLDEAAETIYHISLDDKIRERCEAREDFFRRQRTTERLMERQENRIKEQKQQIEDQEQTISEQKNQISEQKNQISEQKNQISEQKNQISE
ncbi:MAG: Rpn family recombination-promoting nuclease/putative transposase, partial [Lachnospiraceae bacterium]|nr:Rpn family recombination-promoting nuclease/putative transposase [Lachnospiraceae bacterium]